MHVSDNVILYTGTLSRIGLSSFHGIWQHIWCNFLESVSQRDKVFIRDIIL